VHQANLGVASGGVNLINAENRMFSERLIP
jgi:hypothetical protein